MIEKILLFWAILFVFCSCTKDDEQVLYFLGDSMIANWDVESTFPNRITKNLGVDGLHVEGLRNANISDMSAEVVVLVGTNDLHGHMSDDELTSYSDIYEKEICQIGGGRRIFVISVLPTSDKDKNRIIEKFNKEMCQRLKEHTDVIYVDCYDVFIDETGVLREDLSRDGLHLNDYGYILLGDRVKRFL
ncbi:MAG: hypothetical protein K2G12_09960 [Prevotella sp.]|nr:hypothetical protein [Prevotella sp.]